MKRYCKITGRPFEIRSRELEFYGKMNVPPPTLCPEQRQRRRAAFRNERALYYRACDCCGRRIVSVYSEAAPAPAYCPACWWGDGWSGEAFGRPADENLPFFPQFQALMREVPRLAAINKNSENSDYCNQVESLRNCYLIVGSIFTEDSLYGTRVIGSKNCVDCTWVNQCELCYECVDCETCYAVRNARDCSGLHDSAFVFDCSGGSNLLFCAGLRRRSNCILNEQMTPSGFAELRREILDSERLFSQYCLRWEKLCSQVPLRATRGRLYEASEGSYLHECKNAYQAFDAREAEDVAYVYDAIKIKSCADIFSFYGPGELCYEVHSAGVGIFNSMFINDCWPGRDLLYCDNCYDCADCFGCVGLRKKKYCILNREYEPAEYRRARARLIALMQRTEEWGEFFPAELAPFPYQDSVAHEQFDAAFPDAELVSGAVAGRMTVSESDEEILARTFICAATSKNFRIQKPELQFYRSQQLPLPALCPQERHLRRHRSRRGRVLYQRNCAVTGEIILTSLPPNCPNPVYSDAEYDKALG